MRVTTSMADGRLDGKRAVTRRERATRRERELEWRGLLDGRVATRWDRATREGD